MTERDFWLMLYAFMGGMIFNVVLNAAERATPEKFPLLVLAVGSVGLYLSWRGCRLTMRRK